MPNPAILKARAAGEPAPASQRGGFSLLEVAITMIVLSMALVTTADCLNNGSQAAQTLDVGADLQERADYFTSLIALHVRGTSWSGTMGVTQVTKPGSSQSFVNQPSAELEFTPSMGFSESVSASASAVATAGQQIDILLPTGGAGKLLINDLGWGRLSAWTLAKAAAGTTTTQILCADVAPNWVGPNIVNLGFPDIVGTTSGGITRQSNGLGFFVMRVNDYNSNPSLLVIGLCLQVQLPNGRTIIRSSVREVHLSP